MICVSSFRITFSQPSMPLASGQHPGEQSKALCVVLLLALGGRKDGGHWEADFTSAPAEASSSIRLKGPYKKGVFTSQEATVYLYSLKWQQSICTLSSASERGAYLTGWQQSICTLASACLRTSVRGSSVKAEHPKPHPGSIRKEDEENIAWKRKGMAFSRLHIYFFHFQNSNMSAFFL